jgi:type II secretory ATPase GspE/PulE/Tfp pilus assembly ATPase PilB-like protein
MEPVTKELVVFWRKFGRLLGSGTPLFRSLDVTRQETDHTELQQAISDLHATIKAGGTIEDGLAKSPSLFPLSVRTIIKAGETAGRVDKACLDIADGIEEGSLLAGAAGSATEPQTPASKNGKPTEGSGVVAEKEGESDMPIIKMATIIIHEAYKARASDIHLECTTGNLRVRYRIDGVLRDVEPVLRPISQALISRFKIMAGMNVTEKRVPQDGRGRIKIEDKELDLRVSSIPSLDGENLVIRILAAPAELPKLDAQGFTASQLTMLRAWLAKPNGLILVTGPTGSGKTTTLYSMIQAINRPELKILTAEDPVEVRIPGVSQLQIRQALGLTFASALRAFMRQDPDVMVATEIRDPDTAHLMVQAALTGHLVLSALHTQDTSQALQRLIDIGVESSRLNGAVIGVLAQRLIRCVCPTCKEEYQPEPWARESLTLPVGARFFRGKGCERCSQSGYRGRLAIHEMLEMNDALRKAVKDAAGPVRFRELALQAGMVALCDDGVAKAVAGITTLEEVLRVAPSV